MVIRRTCWHWLKGKGFVYTFWKEGGYSKAEEDGGDAVEQEKEEDEADVAVVEYTPFAEVNKQEDGHNDDGNQCEDEVLDEPGQPVLPVP